MKDLAPHTIDLESEKVQFLQEMSTKYPLADIGKAVRCLVNYARENPDRLDEIFGETRCLDCVGGFRLSALGSRQEHAVSIEQSAFA